MHQTKKGNQWYFGMKAYIGADVDSVLFYIVVATPADEADVEVVDELIRRKDSVAYADAGYTGADQRVPRKTLRWEIARRRGQIQKLPEGRQKRRIHAAELAALLVERSRADAMFAADRKSTRLNSSH